MPSLIFTQNGKETGYYNLTDAGLIMGSGHDATLVVESPGISDKHCRFEKKQDLFIVSDLGSESGTFINNLKVEKPVPITTGDIISVGQYEMIFIATADRKGNEQLSMDNIEDAQTIMGAVKPADSKNAPDQWFLEVAGRGSEELLPLSDPEYLIGSSPEADIRLKGLFVPKKLAVIIKSELGIRLINLTGKKILINDIKMETRTILSAKDVITFGPYTLTLLHS